MAWFILIAHLTLYLRAATESGPGIHFWSSTGLLPELRGLSPVKEAMKDARDISKASWDGSRLLRLLVAVKKGEVLVLWIIN